MILHNKIALDYHNSGIKPLPPPFVVLNIYSAHNYKWSKKFYFSGESHKFHEVVYVLEGNATITEDDRIYYLSKGDLILHAPYEFHRIATDRGAHVLVFSFESDELLNETVYDGFFSLSIEEEESFCRLFEKIYEFFHRENEPDGKDVLALEITSLLPAFFMSLATTHKSHHTARYSGGEVEYRKIVEVMRQSVGENLALEDIAARAHISVSYVKHLFHKYAGIGAKQYYTTLRLNEVIRLLEEGVPVDEVAERLSFSSPEYLSLFFKKRMGTPPGRWKNQNKK